MARYSGPAVIARWPEGYISQPTSLVSVETAVERLTQAIPPGRLACAEWSYDRGAAS